MKRIPVTQASYKKIKGANPSPKGVPGASIKVGKPDKSKEKQASYLGWGGFGGFGRPTMIGASSTFYNNTYMNGGRSGGMGDVPPFLAMLNEANGGVLYYPTTLKEKYEFYRYFCYYVDDEQDRCDIRLPDGTTKSIVDLNVGDEIVDGFGKKAIVREKIERKCDDDFAYRFKVATIQDWFKVTHEHPFYVLRRGKLFKSKKDTHVRKDIDFSPEWIMADQIEEGDYFVCPLRTVGNDSSLTVEQATLLGCYASEGSLLYGLRCRTTGYDGRGYSHGDERMKVPVGIQFVINADEEFTYGRRFCDAVMKSFGVRARVASRGENSVVFVANGREIADFCHDNCGKLSGEKRLSELVMNASDEAKLAFLTAYAEGDGCYSVKGGNSGKITIGTNSVNLANQVRTIAFSLGMCCRVVRFHRVPNSGFNGLNPKDGYQVIISANSTDAIVENSVKWSSIKVSKKTHQRGFLIHDGYALFCIRKIELSNGHGIVYNIGVDSDDYDKQCYIANGIVSHNCRSDPYVKAAVELNTDLPLSRLLLRMPKMEDKKRAKKIQRFYENMIDELHLYDKIHSILFEYNVIGNCFPAGHMVHTPYGLLPIEQIREGDMVLTEKGTFEKVLHIMRRNTSEYLYSIKIDKLSGMDFTPTGEHPVFVLRNGQIVCVPANELKRHDYVALEHLSEMNDVNNVDLYDWLISSPLNDKYQKLQITRNSDDSIAIHCEYETKSNKINDTSVFEDNLFEYLHDKELPYERRLTDIAKDLGYDEDETVRFYHVFQKLKKKGVIDYHTTIKSAHERTTIITKVLGKEFNSMRKWNKDFTIKFSNLKITNEFMYMLGYFYGDGWVWNYKRPNSYSYLGMDWIFGKGSERQKERCMEYARKVFGDEATFTQGGYYMSDRPENFHVAVPNPMLAEWWAYNFGTSSDTKRIPLWVEQLPIEKLKWLIAGFIDSDGCVSNENVCIATINEDLMKSVFRIGLKCGIPFNFAKSKSKTIKLPTGNECIARIAYHVNCNGANSGFENSIKYSNAHSEGWKEVKCDAIFEDGRWFYPIADISKKFFKGYVYNLEVENEHTYCVNGICTHNCYLFVQYSEEKKRWDKLTILPPEEVNVANYPLSDIKQIQYRPEQLISTVMKYNLNVESYEAYLESVKQLSEDDQAVLQDVSYEFVKQIKEHNGVLKFDTDPYHGDGDDKIGSFVFHFAHKRHEYQDLGVSPLECVMTSLLQKTHYMFTQLSLASRNMTPRNLIVADKITADALDDLRDQVDQSMLSPDYSIVTNYQVQWEQIGADNRLIDLQRENEVIENQLFAGLGVTRELLTGEGMYSGNKISIEILNTKYLLVREMLQRFVEESLFRPVALQNGFYEDDEDGNRTWFYPRLGFTRLTIRDNQEVFDQLFQLYQKGSLPIGMILDIFNINSDDVDEELKKDLFTVKDATYNEMLRQAYSSMGDKLIENTDLVRQVAESIVGPTGQKLKYTGEDAVEEGGDESFGLGGDGDSGGKEEGGFSLDNLGDEGGEEPASDGDDGFSLDDDADEGADRSSDESDSGEDPEPIDDKVRDYIDGFKNEEDGADAGAREYLDNIVGDSSDENAEKYIDSFLGGGRERESSEDAQDAVLVDDDSCQGSSSSGNDVADFLTGS